MKAPIEIRELVEERRAAFGADATILEIPGIADECEGAYLLATPTEQRVLLFNDYKKELESISIEKGEIGWLDWHEIPANQFFDAKIQDAKAQIVQLKNLVGAWQKMKTGHDIVETRRAAFGEDATAHRLGNDADTAAEIWLLKNGDDERVLFIQPTAVGQMTLSADYVLADGLPEWVEVVADLYRRRRFKKMRGST
ncbi:MAG: hypothetical protein ACK5U4_18770 [Rhodospirillales bacterium]